MSKTEAKVRASIRIIRATGHKPDTYQDVHDTIVASYDDKEGGITVAMQSYGKTPARLSKLLRELGRS